MFIFFLLKFVTINGMAIPSFIHSFVHYGNNLAMVENVVGRKFVGRKSHGPKIRGPKLHGPKLLGPKLRGPNVRVADIIVEKR